MFKSKRNTALRKRKTSSSDEDRDSDVETEKASLNDVLNDTKVLHKIRKRTSGISAEKLSEVQTAPIVYDAPRNPLEDPFNLENGGFVDMKTLKVKIAKGLHFAQSFMGRSRHIAEEGGDFGTGFAQETNKGDHEKDMMRYVEEQLRLRQGKLGDTSSTRGDKDQAQLDALPDFLKSGPKGKPKSEDMLSSQMLSGIPEVDLGIETKIRNIEATEEAKMRMLKEARSQDPDAPSDFIPANVSVNFVQHNRFETFSASKLRI